MIILFLPGRFTTDDAIDAGVRLLGIPQGPCAAECKRNRGGYLRFSFLEDVYRRHLDAGKYKFAARAYLLLMVGYTIFSDKSATAIPVKWVKLFEKYKDCGQWAWAPAALAYLYQQLHVGSHHKGRQLGGYATLLQVKIFD